MQWHGKSHSSCPREDLTWKISWTFTFLSQFNSVFGKTNGAYPFRTEQNRWLQPSTAVRGIFTPHVLLYLFSNAKLARLTIKPRPAEEEYPDLTQHNNHMAKYLTLDVYKRLRQRCTPNGFTIDNVIQTGVDNPGKRTHIVCQGSGPGLDSPERNHMINVKHGFFL